MNITFVYADRLTPAAVAAFVPSVIQLSQLQPVVVAGIVYQPYTAPVTVMRPFDSSSKNDRALVVLLYSAACVADTVNGCVLRSVKLIRTAAMDFATTVPVATAGAGALVPLVVVVPAVELVSASTGAGATIRKSRAWVELATRRPLPLREPLTVTVAPFSPAGPPSANETSTREGPEATK